MLAQTSPAAAPVALETLSLSGPFTHPRDFLLAVMNDPQAGSLARGFSGVRREVVQSLLDALNAGFIP
ncbi:MAG: hypothetical protein E7K47_10285, partial [Acidovorax sp.]|nr:hypothetical protein [Acidovorax sp.]